MQPCNRTKFLAFLTLAVLVCAPCLATAAAKGVSPSNGQQPTARDKYVHIYLGKVEVIGEKKVIETLQAIKVGLRQPYSTDPKLANVVVCRLVDEAGSHINQWLICGTNRILSQNRDTLHTVMTAATSDTDQPSDPGDPGYPLTCLSDACYSAVFSVLDEALSSQPGHYLHTRVSGPGLRTLLQEVPYPAPPQATNAAPTATTRHL